MSEYMTLQEAAEYAHVSRSTLSAWMKRGYLAALPVSPGSRAKRVRRCDIDAAFRTIAQASGARAPSSPVDTRTGEDILREIGF